MRPDGKRLFGGALPTLIQWGEVHPADAMPVSGVQLTGLTVGALPEAAARRLPTGVSTQQAFAATLATPAGTVRLEGAA